MNILKTIFITLLTLISLSTITLAQNYADIEIYVENDGSVSIEGTTNYIPLQNIENSQIFTSKKGEFWLLNITTKDKFDNFIFELNLPEGSQTNYIKTTPNVRIQQSDNRIKLIGTGENKPLTLVVQYKINPTNKLFTQTNIIAILVTLIVITTTSIIVIFFKITNKPQQIITETKKEEEKPKYNIENLPERQQEIIKLIEKNKKMTQKQLEANMNIPKSSVSRNVQALVLKQILEKEKAGQSNYITLKK